jgi:hypothetical protein
MYERGTDVRSLYNAACSRAILAAAIRASDGTTDRTKRADAEAARAMTLLTKAVSAGYTIVGHIKRDPDLKDLHSRDDFKKLVADLEAKGVKPKQTEAANQSGSDPKKR